MSQMPTTTSPAPFMRDPEKAYNKEKHLEWEESLEYESDSDSDSEYSTDSDESSESASSYTASSSSASGSSSSASSSAYTKKSKPLSSARLSGKRSSVSASSASSSASSSSSSASSSSASSSSASSSVLVTRQPKAKASDIYRIEEQPVTGMFGAITRWRMKQAAKRRHPTLLHFEEVEILELERNELAKIERDKQRIKEEKEKIIGEIARKKQSEFYERIRRRDVARYEAEVAERVRQSTQTKVVMGLVEEWGLEADKRRADRDALAVLDDIDRRGNAAGVKFNARKAGENAGVEAARAQDEADTQEVLAIMRRAGVIQGVNSPAKPEDDLQKETNKHIILNNRPEEETRGAVRDRKFTFFTIDIRKYKNAESMKGCKIGTEGAVFLSEQLRMGCCPRLKKLDLSWCCIRKVGCDRIIDAFAKIGETSLVEVLNLRMNHMPASSVKRLVRHLRNSDTLKNLKELDLRQNVIGDEGGGALAHAILSGGIPTLRKLNVSSNQLTDIGVSALFKAFNAETICCPKIENVNCRDNVVSAKMLRSFDPCPIYFQV